MDGIICKEKDGIRWKYYAFMHDHKNTPDAYLHESTGSFMKKQSVEPLYICIENEAFYRKLVLPDELNPGITPDGKVIQTLMTKDKVLNNELLAKIFDGQVAQAYIDQPDASKEIFIGMGIGGLYTLMFARPDLFQNPILGMGLMAGMMGLMMWLMTRY